ncbi:MAG: hypothetical protein ACO1OG_03235 [Devosia sp.]
MTNHEIATLEHAGRSALAWTPESYDGRTHYGSVLAAIIPAVGILVVAASLLFSVL